VGIQVCIEHLPGQLLGKREHHAFQGIILGNKGYLYYINRLNGKSGDKFLRIMEFVSGEQGREKEIFQPD